MALPKVHSTEEWEQKLSEVTVDKGELNKLVMNYLVIEGFKDAAERFSEESGTKPDVDLESIVDRMSVRSSIQNGDVYDAMERVNDLDPLILDTNPKLFFHLQQQRLVELIRGGNTDEALQFAQEELAPRGEENPEFLEELERTMALLAFEDQSNCPVSELLENSQRQKTASELNAAILESQCQEQEPRLPHLLRMLVWIQGQLQEKAGFPALQLNDLSVSQHVGASEGQT